MNQTNLALKKLKGIKPKGVKVKDKSTFEILFEGYQKVVAEWDPKYGIDNADLLEIPRLISADLDNDLMKNTEFKKSHLDDFILASNEWDICGDEEVYRGIYTGALLTLLSKRTKQRGEKAEFCFNGDGMIYPFLFYAASHMDVLVLRNFNGHHIGNFINKFDEEFSDRAVLIHNNVFGQENGNCYNDNCIGVTLGCYSNSKTFKQDYSSIESIKNNFAVTVGRVNTYLYATGYQLFLPEFNELRSSRVNLDNILYEYLKLKETRDLLLNSLNSSDDELLNVGINLKNKYDNIYNKIK